MNAIRTRAARGEHPFYVFLSHSLIGSCTTHRGVPFAAVSSDERAAAQRRRRCDPALSLCSVRGAQRRTMIIASASVSVSVSNVHTHPKCWSRCLSLRAVSMKISLQGSRWLPSSGSGSGSGSLLVPKSKRARVIRPSRPRLARVPVSRASGPPLSAVRRALASWQS